MAGPLSPFSCSLNRLKPDDSGKGLVCSQQTPGGAPLLAIPLAACWSKQAALVESNVLAESLAPACARDPGNSLLGADHTWIILHLLHERAKGSGASPIRRSHLALLPAAPDSLLSWDDEDTEGLRGSWWYDEAARLRERADLDFKTLQVELGPARAAALGLDRASYFWARAILEQFGVHVLEDDGSLRTLLVPGIELLQPNSAAPTNTGGARLDCSTSTFLILADKDYFPGDRVRLCHGGLACSSGHSLARGGWLPSPNPWESVIVALPLQLDRVPGDSGLDAFSDLLQGLSDACASGLVDGVPEPEPGECAPADQAFAPAPIDVTDTGTQVLCKVLLRFTKERLLPSQMTLVHIGTALAADRGKQEYLMSAEKELEGVFNNECCERRALEHLQFELQSVLRQYPSATKESTLHLARAEVEGQQFPRSARCLRLVNNELELLRDVMVAVQKRLGLLLAAAMSPAGFPLPPAQQPVQLAADAISLALPEKPQGRRDLVLPLELLAKDGKEGLPPPQSALAKALLELSGLASALRQLAGAFRAATASGPGPAAAAAVRELQQELPLLLQCLGSCLLGDPSLPSLPVSTASSGLELVRLHSEAGLAALSAQLAASEWERKLLESQGAAAAGGEHKGRKALVSTLQQLADFRARLQDFEGAHADLRSAVALQQSEAKTTPLGAEHRLALDSAVAMAMALALRRPEVLAEPAGKWSGAAQAKGLQALRQRLRDVGYMAAAERWTWPARLPLVRNMAEPGAWAGREVATSASLPQRRPGIGMYVSRSGEGEETRGATDAPSRQLDPSLTPYVLPQGKGAQELVAAIRLFLLHKTLPLGPVRNLLGEEAFALLLSVQALVCVRPSSGELLTAEEALALGKAKGSAAEEPLIFSNVLLWPAPENLLLALDFEQGLWLEGIFEPVPYLAQDARALMLAAPQTSAASVLDVCCGSGAQGLAALQHNAKQAAFLDSNPRALRFASFNAHLNGLGERCTFVQGSLCTADVPGELLRSKYDAIVLNSAFLPNPFTAVTNGGVAFAKGGEDGERVLSAVVAKAAGQLLAPGGRLVAAALLPNVGGLAKRLLSWADSSRPASEPAELRGVVLRGQALALEDFVHLSTQGCSAATAAAYLAALRRRGLRSLSETLVLLQAPAAGRRLPRHERRLETLPERSSPSLWTDEALLRQEVPAALQRLLETAAQLDETAGGAGAPATEGLYSLDWAAGQTCAISGASTPLQRSSLHGPWLPESQETQKTSQGREYRITLDRRTGTNLGAQVNPTDGVSLLLESVLGGLLRDWNLANPRLQVHKGDRILEVNGISGSAAQMLEECRQHKTLEMRLQRRPGEAKAPAPSPPQLGQFIADACRWKDVALHRLLGWSPPALCDWRWYKTALPLSAAQRGTPPSGFTMATVELQGCRCPSEVKEALRSVNCSARYTFEGEPRMLKPMEKSMQAEDMSKLLDRYDCLILPLETGGGRFHPLHDLPVEMIHFLDAISRYVFSTRRPIRLVMLTCGCSGPSYAGMSDDGYGMPAAVPLRGIFRCSRIESLQVPILHIDSDALVEPGRGKELVAQLDVELELSTPDVGFYKADVTEQNRAITLTHREVAYRGGVRMLPKLDLCARNPIFPGAKIPALMGPAAEGVAVITGGTGGLGLMSAEALVESGVRKIVLSSRSGKISRGYQGLDARLEGLRMSGARIELEACDVKDEGQVQAFLQKIRTNLGPIKWILNAAGIVLAQDPNLMEMVFEPKCLGAWNMHKHSLADDIKTFMMYSSMSAGAGANDLANYAAANTYIDELARLRQAQGLAAVSVMFPEVEEAGMAADGIFVKGNPANIPPGNVKQTIRQIVCGKGPMAPCVVIMAQGYLIPRSPTMDSMLEPLKARVDQDLWNQLTKAEASTK